MHWYSGFFGSAPPKEAFSQSTWNALRALGLGWWDEALEWLDRAIEARDPIIMPIKTFPFLDPVRGDARFRALLRKMRLG